MNDFSLKNNYNLNNYIDIPVIILNILIQSLIYTKIAHLLQLPMQIHLMTVIRDKNLNILY